jgi:DNA-binding LytR/AlgR family response regulator
VPEHSDELSANDMRIPYERNKKILFVDSAEVATIRADGRYTQLYTRTGVCFCPWSITEGEKRLFETQFYRSHRSYLVNVQLISSFEKRKDSGVCLFDGFAQISSVPVSRTRVSGLMELLGLA